MRLLILADGRSPIAVNWLRYLVEAGHEVHLVSSFPCQFLPGLASGRVLPLALSGLKPGGSGSGRPAGRLWSASLAEVRMRTRQWIGPLTLYGAARQLHRISQDIQPDLVHAMRIPYEGMTAALAGLSQPLLISVWGNDFTLHAPTTPLMRSLTRHALDAAQALHTDCHRDLRLARAWGFHPTKPGIVIPTSGGIRREIFYPPQARPGSPRVINPRGFRAYVRSDTFFAALPQVLERYPAARFLCPSMAGDPQAGRLLAASGCASQVDLLSHQTPAQMAELYRQAQVAVSPTIHDGTPNTLLEAMACGCFPVAGDLESLREWITPGVNGLLIDPGSPADLAAAILTALDSESLRTKAQVYNQQLIASQAEQSHVMAAAQAFYQEVAASL
jgi:glycosyltransferase involved in cell wall biosynthesis